MVPAGETQVVVPITTYPVSQDQPCYITATYNGASDHASFLQGGIEAVFVYRSDDPRYLERMLELGYFVSFAGTLTFKNATALRSMAARVPLERLLVETDCPYLAPSPRRGQRNEPAFVRYTATCLAEILGVSFDAIVERTWTNSLELFPSLKDVPQERVA